MVNAQLPVFGDDSMKTGADDITINWINVNVESIKKKINREKKNLIDSGFTEDHPMFEELFWLIQKEYMKDLLPFAAIRHRLEPYGDEERKEYDMWMFILYDATLDKPPEELLRVPSGRRHKGSGQKGKSIID